MSNVTRHTFTIEDALCIKAFADRNPVRLSADGRFVSYAVEDRSGEAVREQFWVTDIDEAKSRQILPDALNSWGGSWSPTEDVVAFAADFGDGPRLWFYHAETGETRQVSSATLAHTPFHFCLPQWLPDGNALICALSSRIGRPGYDHLGRRVARKAPVDEAAKDGVSVRYWESPPAGDAPGGAGICSAPLSFRSWGTLARIDSRDGTAQPLVEDIQCGWWDVSPDGRYVAYMQFTAHQSGANLYRLCAVAANGGDARVLDPHVVEGYAVSVSWSPDSTQIAYCPSHQVAVVSLDGARPSIVMPYSQGIIDDFYEAPLWSLDGSFLLCTRDATVWRIPARGGEPTDLLPNRGTLGVRGIAAPGGGPLLWSPNGKSAIVEVRDWKSGEIGLALIGLAGDGVLRSTQSMQMLSDVPRYHLDVSPTRGIVSFVRQSAAQPPDVWAIEAALASPWRITALNPHTDESEFSSPGLIRWIGPDGREHRSAYFPPAGAGDPPHPVILWVYEGNQSGFLSGFRFDLQLLTNHGYGVCLPDQVRMSLENQAEALRGMLACAVKSLIDEAIADPARIGIFGHSFGGYIVNVAITGLDCFAAAVASAGVANYTSAHGTPSQSGDESCSEGIESGQPHMGVPPWKDPQRYIENSPVFALDRVTTPVLIVFGEQDEFVSQAWEMFNGLRHLNRPAALAIYQGEDHAQCDWRRPNVVDFWQRVLGWFDRYM